MVPLDFYELGPRMSILPAESPLAAHELNDSGGIARGKDGSVTAWYRQGWRLSSPSWSAWSELSWR